MSNNVSRPPLPGIIRQRGKIVGSIQLPPDAAAFMEHFNREYAALDLRVERVERVESLPVERAHKAA
jgi:hypothetical protein